MVYNSSRALGTDIDDPHAAAERLAENHAMEMGSALARQDRVGEAVLAMIETGAQPDDVISGLVMAGMARRVRRFRDFLPHRRGSAPQSYIVSLNSLPTAYPE